jgi:murein DD-endopeptidase MepM/ murein hydrolase activator NlpD
MPSKSSFAALCLLGLLRQTYAQEVIIPREEKPRSPTVEIVTPLPSPAEAHGDKTSVAQSLKSAPPENRAISKPLTAKNVEKTEPAAASIAKQRASVNDALKLAPVSPLPKATSVATKPSDAASKAAIASAPPLKSQTDFAQSKTASVNIPRPKRLTWVPGPAAENHSGAEVTVPPATETAFTKLADGFDFPVGKPDAQGYYKARGFRSHGHLGEDWDGIGGGNTDLGDPIYSIGDGLVVFARDCHMGWGNVMIVRHSYREGGAIKTIDVLYGHLDKMLAHRGQAVARGQQIGTMGTAHGLYDAHLHLEIRKNIEVGMSRTAFARDFTNYYDPSQFILAHRHVPAGGRSYRVAMNTFVRDSTINFDKARNFRHSHTGGGTRESAVALKKALVAKP